MQVKLKQDFSLSYLPLFHLKTYIILSLVKNIQLKNLGLAEGGKDACQGDSGGPLVTKATGVDAGYSLIGVVSFGIGCGKPGLYGIYAEFSKFLGWVEEVFNIPPPPPPTPWDGQNVTSK